MSTNISKKKRDDLLDKIKQIRAFIAAAPQDENTGNLLSYLSELEKDVNGKKYGLVFEEHREEIDEVLDTHTPVLTEEADLFIDHGGQMNFLLEGDNLAALKLLEKTHRGKIKMIYIDPPYNTANKDFAYDDTRVDLTDTFRHSKWLSFMRERLRIARNLLRDDGILFISIDDNEQSDLKLLCDEIFKEENFFSQVIIQSNKRGQTYKQIAKTHEYLLIYTRSPEAEFNEIDKTDDDNDLNLLDKIGAYNVRELRNRNPKFGKHNRPNLFYPIYVNPSIVDKDGFCPISLAYTTDYCVEVYPFNSTGGESCWRWSTKLLSENINSNTQFSNVVARAKRDGTFNIYEKYRKTTYKAKSIWLETDVITEKGTVELGELGLSERFPFPKPLFLLKKCLQIGTNSNDIILDFFAGSGTTGHAVMKLNAEDGGTRRFILCTNNENGICRDVTYERIRRVIDKEDYAASLKYYKVDYVPISDRMYYEYADELLRHIRELVELENGINFTGNEEIAIVLTDEELEIFLDDEGICKRCRKLYMGHDVLLDAQQAQALQEYNITSSEKVVWLDSYEDLKNGNYDVIFKSAKYNHVRNEIDTETMQERGRRKRPQDGDEEKTHLCIRLAKGENRFLAVHESNHYGITLKCIIDYLNEQFKKFNEDGNDPYHYTIESQIMPGEDFLSSIKRAKTMSVLKLTVYKDDIKDGFMRFAGRTDIADEVDICLKRPKGYKCFPENLIKEYFKDSQDKAKGKIKRIKIIGTNDAGSFEVDTNITGMKHFLKVKGESVTNEVESSDFFVKAQEFIASMGGRI